MVELTTLRLVRIYLAVQRWQIDDLPAKVVRNGGNNIRDPNQAHGHPVVIDNRDMSKAADMHFIQGVCQRIFRSKIFWIRSHEFIHGNQVQVVSFTRYLQKDIPFC